MVSTTSFIQVNLQHSISAFRILTRRLSDKGTDRALIQELWYHENCIRGLNIPGYNLYSAGGIDRPTAYILLGSMTSWMLPGFSCRDLVAVSVQYLQGRSEKQLLICSAYLPYYSEDPPPTQEVEELVQYCEDKYLYLITGCDSNVHHSARGSTDCSNRIAGASNLEILNWAMNPPVVDKG
jgi:hypothetical protein